jgi:small subunit ribosomal protein S14
MSRKCLIERNSKRLSLVARGAAKRRALKAKIYDKKISLEDRYNLIIELASMSRDCSRSRLRNRCMITGRPRGYYRKVGLSRIMLRDLAGKGELPGLVKSSW